MVDNKQISFLKNILLSDDIVNTINNNIELLLEYIPQIKPMIGFLHNHPHHHLDVWDHTLYALSLSKCDFDIRLTLLLHDIGKPFSYQDDEVRHFHGHPLVSSNIARNILKRFDLSEDYISEICYLITNHDTPIKADGILKDYNLQLKRYEVQRCDALAHHPLKLEKRKQYLEDTKILLRKIR